MHRREFVSALGALPDGGTPGTSSTRAVKPLPFDATKLRGLSAALLNSHHDNNYAGAVKNLGKVEEELAKLKADAPSALVGGLRERALQFHNSMTLHEWYFGNLGGDGKQSGALAKVLPSSWEQDFRATALSLAGGSGWVTLGLHSTTGELFTAWSSNHTQALAQPAAPRARHVRTLVRVRLRRGGREVRRRVLREREVGRGGASLRAGAGGVEGTRGAVSSVTAGAKSARFVTLDFTPGRRAGERFAARPRASSLHPRAPEAPTPRGRRPESRAPER